MQRVRAPRDVLRPQFGGDAPLGTTSFLMLVNSHCLISLDLSSGTIGADNAHMTHKRKLSCLYCCSCVPAIYAIAVATFAIQCTENNPAFESQYDAYTPHGNDFGSPGAFGGAPSTPDVPETARPPLGPAQDKPNPGTDGRSPSSPSSPPATTPSDEPLLRHCDDAAPCSVTHVCLTAGPRTSRGVCLRTCQQLGEECPVPHTHFISNCALFTQNSGTDIPLCAVFCRTPGGNHPCPNPRQQTCLRVNHQLGICVAKAR